MIKLEDINLQSQVMFYLNQEHRELISRINLTIKYYPRCEDRITKIETALRWHIFRVIDDHIKDIKLDYTKYAELTIAVAKLLGKFTESRYDVLLRVFVDVINYISKEYTQILLRNIPDKYSEKEYTNTLLRVYSNIDYLNKSFVLSTFVNNSYIISMMESDRICMQLG